MSNDESRREKIRLRSRRHPYALPAPLSFHSISSGTAGAKNIFHPFLIQHSHFVIPQFHVAGLTLNEQQGIIFHFIMKSHNLRWLCALVMFTIFSTAGSLVLGGCSGASMKQVPVETLLYRNETPDVEFKSSDELPIGVVDPRLEVWLLRNSERKPEVELTIRIVPFGRSEIHTDAKVPVSRTYRDRSGRIFDRYDGPVALRNLKGVRIKDIFVQFADSSLSANVDSIRFHGWSR